MLAIHAPVVIVVEARMLNFGIVLSSLSCLFCSLLERFVIIIPFWEIDVWATFNSWLALGEQTIKEIIMCKRTIVLNTWTSRHLIVRIVVIAVRTVILKLSVPDFLDLVDSLFAEYHPVLQLVLLDYSFNSDRIGILLIIIIGVLFIHLLLD